MDADFEGFTTAFHLDEQTKAEVRKKQQRATAAKNHACTSLDPCKHDACKRCKLEGGEESKLGLEGPLLATLQHVHRLTEQGDLAQPGRISKILSVSPATAGRYLLALEQGDYLKHFTDGRSKNYLLTTKGRRIIDELAYLQEYLQEGGTPPLRRESISAGARLHAVQAKVPIHRRPDHDAFMQMGWKWKENLKDRYFGYEVAGVSIVCYPSVLVLVLPDILASAPQVAVQRAGELVRQVLDALKAEHKGFVFGTVEFDVDGRPVAHVDVEISKLEVGMPDDAFAERLEAMRTKIRSKRWTNDNSGGTELDFDDPTRALQDAGRYQTLLDDVVEGQYEGLPEDVALNQAAMRTFLREHLAEMVAAREDRMANQGRLEAMDGRLDRTTRILEAMILSQASGQVGGVGVESRQPPVAWFGVEGYA